MWLKHKNLLVCPTCKTSMELNIFKQTSEKIEEGELTCNTCKSKYSISKFIPRFVPQGNYSSNFGIQWNYYAKTQVDSFNGTTISHDRFFKQTKWTKQLQGELMLEVGCGSGRFTEQALKTGATLVSIDLSDAVDANYANNGNNPNVLIIQASVYDLPLQKAAFNKVFCIGVIQHTPDVKKTFDSLAQQVKPGGALAVDSYRYSFPEIIFRTKYWVRPITKRVKPEKMHKWVKGYINFMWPIASVINKLPFGRKINKALLICDYRGELPLNEQMLKEWAILDTFDNLSPAYDFPQSVKTLTNWYAQNNFEAIEVHNGENGVEGRGVLKK
jgi:2-polyprenyl-3-methyl-5-hydroxy-6-metoxy-1,4-benzoquinol methylase/uncharacterized protein YbaR (Trm112 family)